MMLILLCGLDPDHALGHFLFVMASKDALLYSASVDRSLITVTTNNARTWKLKEVLVAF
jgi:hypothetical protein